MTKFAELLGGYKQSSLSQFETRAEGPPIKIVEEYARFFKLDNKDRFDFYLAAIEASEELVINTKEVHLFFKEIFQNFFTFILSDRRARKIFESMSIESNKDLFDSWDNFFLEFKKFIEIGKNK